jgi:hypothetical protein
MKVKFYLILDLEMAGLVASNYNDTKGVYPTSANGIISTKQNIKNLIDEIETITK